MSQAECLSRGRYSVCGLSGSFCDVMWPFMLQMIRRTIVYKALVSIAEDDVVSYCIKMDVFLQSHVLYLYPIAETPR